MYFLYQLVLEAGVAYSCVHDETSCVLSFWQGLRGPSCLCSCRNYLDSHHFRKHFLGVIPRKLYNGQPRQHFISTLPSLTWNKVSLIILFVIRKVKSSRWSMAPHMPHGVFLQQNRSSGSSPCTVPPLVTRTSSPPAVILLSSSCATLLLHIGAMISPGFARDEMSGGVSPRNQ